MVNVWFLFFVFVFVLFFFKFFGGLGLGWDVLFFFLDKMKVTNLKFTKLCILVEQNVFQWT